MSSSCKVDVFPKYIPRSGDEPRRELDAEAKKKKRDREFALVTYMSWNEYK